MGRRGSIQSARRVRRSITTAIACLCSSPAISHLAGEPDPALLVPTDNWTNHSHSLRANYSPYLPSSSSPLSLSLFLCLSFSLSPSLSITSKSDEAAIERIGRFECSGSNTVMNLQSCVPVYVDEW